MLTDAKSVSRRLRSEWIVDRYSRFDEDGKPIMPLFETEAAVRDEPGAGDALGEEDDNAALRRVTLSLSGWIPSLPATSAARPSFLNSSSLGLPASATDEA